MIETQSNHSMSASPSKKSWRRIRYSILAILLLIVRIIQVVPSWGAFYYTLVYPIIGKVLSTFSCLFPFSINDLFIACSIVGVLVYPFWARIRKKMSWKRIVLNDIEYLAWIYVWFYLAWGLNYSQPNFYQRTEIPYAAYTPENVQRFTDEYIDLLNESDVSVNRINESIACAETV